MDLSPLLRNLVGVGLAIAVAVPLHRFLRRASATASLVAGLIVAGVLAVAVLVVLAR